MRPYALRLGSQRIRVAEYQGSRVATRKREVRKKGARHEASRQLNPFLPVTKKKYSKLLLKILQVAEGLIHW